MKNISVINRQVAKDLGLPLNVVEAVNSKYWKDAKKKAVTFQAQTVSIRNIGNLTISWIKLRNYILLQIRRIREIPNHKTTTEEKKKARLELTYTTLRKLLVLHNELAIQRKQRQGRFTELQTGEPTE